MTRIERIKKMSKEEFKDFLIDLCDCKLCKYRDVDCFTGQVDCEDGINEWLLEEVQE